MVKLRSDGKDDKAAEQFLNDMADKPYGADERVERVTISMRGHIFDQLDDEVRRRKRAKKENRTMSALVVEAIEYYVNHKMGNNS